ncbi:MAG TPA: peptide chain release factor 1 [Clostridiaceae bacterium]|jgi:peptide chain release factor 1|nr:peptide chain release factor 1 [Clostridiaceae bacterium]
MFERLEAIENRYEELNMRLADPSVVNDQEQYLKLMKEHSELTEIVEKFREHKKYKEALEDAKLMLDEKPDKELAEMIEAEIDDAREGIARTERELKILLMPKDPNDEKDVIVEIRAGAGGEEAALFAAVLFRMYSHYAESKGWQTSVIDSNPTEIGGFKEIVFEIEGKGAYSRLKYESGVHRVQRVPTTESSGRIHTSTATVAVLPEAEDVGDVEINPNDIEVDTYRASGAGGQHVNKTSSAIRITHIPSGIVVTCQDQRSQHKNREKAMKVLKAKLYEIERQKHDSELAENRKSQVGTGDRSERIRTYNFPQRRVTDHRIGFTLYQIEQFINGDMDEMIDALITTDQANKLTNGEDL